ncbi:hypothetical protein BKA59DRAFT_519833 [Fusarium tricinctum]|uniref:Clr5 domain-containing protein n=1 Tax=Fusarium tricinctum TaxID=61284 RepID=A0A8K0S8T6_9HYPO|nr:hypothetical protein BKA59DRAFT_519833 [Fusarium tricinctum]
MAQREISFIYSRARRAAGVSDKALDEHKDLIGDLYLTQNYTRDQVITYLNEELRFKISPSQFSKATRRWGFHKQPHGGTSNEIASQHATNDPSQNDLSYTINSVGIADQRPLLTNESNKRPRSATSSPSPGSNTMILGPYLPPFCPSEKRSKPRRDLDETIVRSLLHSELDLDSDGEITLTSPTEDKSTEPSPLLSQLSAEYLACCYRYTKAFGYYNNISISYNNKTFSAEQRRARMLDMARVAKTRRTSTTLLPQRRAAKARQKKAEMCRMESFLFHRHLAQIYARRRHGSSLMQKHLDNARNFTKAFDTHGPAPIDLWTLLCLVQEKKDLHIPEDLFSSLQWDTASYGVTIGHCLYYCWGKLKPTVSLHEASKRHDARQCAGTEPTDMSDLTLQNSPLHLWKRSSILSTFLWKEVQLTHGTPLPWGPGHPTISSAHILMIVSRIITKRSCMMSKHSDDQLHPEKRSLEIHPKSLELYCDALLGLFHDNLFKPEQVRREFVTQFIDHHSWSPPSASKSVITSQVQDYQMEALKSVLSTKRNNIFDHVAIKEAIASTKKVSENRRVLLPDNDFSSWFGDQQDPRASTRQKQNDSYAQWGQHPPASCSSNNSSYFPASASSYRIYIDAIRGNPVISRPLASQSSRSSQKSASSSLRRFKASALSWQHKVEPTMTLSGNSEVLVEDEFALYH